MLQMIVKTIGRPELCLGEFFLSSIHFDNHIFGEDILHIWGPDG